MKDYDQRAREIMRTVIYSTVATVSNAGMPWNSPVRHIVTEDFTIYWFSDLDTQHTCNIIENGKVFIVIYDSSVPEGSGEGVYIEGVAEIVDNEQEITELRNAFKGEELNDGHKYIGDATRRCFRVVPMQVWMNESDFNDGIFTRDYRINVQL